MSAPRSSTTPGLAAGDWILYIVLAGIVMLFAGLLSAYLSGSVLPDNRNYSLPAVFWLSSVWVLMIHFTTRGYLKWYTGDRVRKVQQYLAYTLVLSVAFLVSQWLGWQELMQQGIYLQGSPGASYLYVISGLHGLHVVVGIVMLVVGWYRVHRAGKHAGTSLYYFSNPVQARRIRWMAAYWRLVGYIWLVVFMAFLFRHSTI